MRTDSDVNKIWGNITPPNDKARTILATMHKGVAANGMTIVLSLFEVWLSLRSVNDKAMYCAFNTNLTQLREVELFPTSRNLSS